MPSGKETVIAGNTKTGRLISVGPNTYIGERIGPKRQMEQKRFYCSKSQANQMWRDWQEEAKQEAFIRVKTERKPRQQKEIQDMPTVAKEQVKRPTVVYLLAFKGQRTSKPVAAYIDFEAAINMQDALTVALDVQGVEGEYTVEEIPVWPREKE